MKANIEGDELLYRAAFSVEKQAYKVHIFTTDRDDIGPGILDKGAEYTATELHNIMKEKGLDKKDYMLQGYKVLVPNEEESLPCAINLLKQWLDRISTYAPDGLNLWLSPSNGSNFRYKIATTPRIVNGEEIKGYKAARPPRPLHYEALRQFLITEYLAVEINGYEADDALGIHKGLMCHIDKDINMVAGEHYHWVNDERYTIKDGLGTIEWNDGKLKAHGKYMFYCQLLMGDSTDNIPGLVNLDSNKGTNYGPKTVFDIVSNYRKEKELLAKVKELYYNVYKSSWQERLNEIADLVWIVQTPEITGSMYINQLVESNLDGQ